METILEKIEIISGKELNTQFRDIINTAGLDRAIRFTTEEMYDFLIKEGYKIYIIDIYAEIYTKKCYDWGKVTYEDPKSGVAQTIVALLPTNEVPTTQEGIGEYSVYSVFDKLMKEKLLNL